jgi:hypothetical protein
MTVEEVDSRLVVALQEVVAGDRERLGDRAVGEYADVVAFGAGVRR